MLKKTFIIVFVIAIAIGSIVLSAQSFLVWISGIEPAQLIPVKEQFQYFMQDTGINVNFRNVPYDESMLRSALMGGSGPDYLAMDGPAEVPYYASAGFLLPLDKYAKEYGWDKILPDFWLKLGEYNGHLYAVGAGLNSGLESMMLFYNPTVFKENGWQPPKTIAELDELCAEMQKKGIIPFSNGTVGWFAADEWIVSAAWNAIAGPEKVYEALKGEIPWTDPAFVRATQETKKWYDNGWLGGGHYFSTSLTDQYSLLLSGKAGMAIIGTWAIGDLLTFTKSATEWDWAPFPTATDVSYPVFASAVAGENGININCKDPDAVAAYLNWVIKLPFTDPQLWPKFLALEVSSGGETDCPRIGLNYNYDDLAKAGVDPRALRFIADMTEAYENGHYGYTTWTYWPPESDTYIIQNISKVWVGSMSVDQFLTGLQGLYSKELKNGQTLYIPQRSQEISWEGSY